MPVWLSIIPKLLGLLAKALGLGFIYKKGKDTARLEAAKDELENARIRGEIEADVARMSTADIDSELRRDQRGV